MAEALLWIASIALACMFAWNLGVRRERGRQAKIEAVQQKMTEEVRRRKGTKLHTIRVRR